MKEPIQSYPSASKYSLDALEKHTQSIRILAKKSLKKYRTTLDEALTEFNDYIDRIEKLPSTLERNVKLLLGCKFLNHMFLHLFSEPSL